MTLPVPDKTWQFNVNQVKPTSDTVTTDCKTILLSIKKALTTFASNPWTVVGSSDGSTAGMDAVDRWPISLTGTDTNATVNTSTNNVIRIRSIPNAIYTQFTVTAGASTAKSTIASDLNTGFAANSLSLNATVNGSNQIVITDTSAGNAYIEIDTIANGSTLGTPCGFTSGGMSTISKLVWAAAGSVHSWIVLRQTNLTSTFDLCLDCSNANSYNMTIVVGLTGFTGGSTTARPTATTSVTCISNNYWLQGSTILASYVLHVMQSSDGQCTRVVAGIGTNTTYTPGQPLLFWIFDVPKSPASGWTNPCFFYVSPGSTTNIMTLSGFEGNARMNFYANSVLATAYMTCEGAGASAIPLWNQLQKPNDISGEHLILPIGLVSDTTSAKGRHGQVYDLWWGNVNAQSRGGLADVTYPSTSTRTHWQCGDFILPWPGLNSPPGPKPIMTY